MTIIIEIITGALLFSGLKIILSAVLNKHYSYAGHAKFRKLQKLNKTSTDIWNTFPINKLLATVSTLAYIDESTENSLQKQLTKAGLTDTPREYTAKKYLTILLGVVLSALCAFSKFYIGIILMLLVSVFFMLKLRDTISEKIKIKDLEIAAEMPRFTRTICRNLQSDRDLLRVIQSYRKVAGRILGAELDILLAEMQSGNMQIALSHFETRIGTADAFRLCSALRDMAMGVNQTATLSYLADSMAAQAKENIRKELSLRPEKMRATYYPAIGVTVAMIMYILVVYVMNSLNSII